MNWGDISVVFNTRQSGKTTWVMDQVHALAVENRLGEVLVIVSNSRQVSWWLREWQNKYPALHAPMIVTINNPLRVRGHRFEKIFVEDIEVMDEGIYERKLFETVYPSLAHARDPEVVFTCSPTPFSYEPLHEQQAREAREKVEQAERLRAAREGRRRFIDDLLIRYIGVTGEIPKLPDEILNPRRYEESSDTIA